MAKHTRLALSTVAICGLVLWGCESHDAAVGGSSANAVEEDMGGDEISRSLRQCNQSDANDPVDVAVFVGADGCLEQRRVDGVTSCVAPAVIEAERGQKLKLQSAVEDRLFAIVDNPRSPRPQQFDDCHVIIINGRATWGDYKYNIVGQNNAACHRNPFPENVCDPRIRIDPQ